MFFDLLPVIPELSPPWNFTKSATTEKFCLFSQLWKVHSCTRMPFRRRGTLRGFCQRWSCRFHDFCPSHPSFWIFYNFNLRTKKTQFIAQVFQNLSPNRHYRHKRRDLKFYPSTYLYGATNLSFISQNKWDSFLPENCSYITITRRVCRCERTFLRIFAFTKVCIVKRLLYQ